MFEECGIYQCLIFLFFVRFSEFYSFVTYYNSLDKILFVCPLLRLIIFTTLSYRPCLSSLYFSSLFYSFFSVLFLIISYYSLMFSFFSFFLSLSALSFLIMVVSHRYFIFFFDVFCVFLFFIFSFQHYQFCFFVFLLVFSSLGIIFTVSSFSYFSFSFIYLLIFLLSFSFPFKFLSFPFYRDYSLPPCGFSRLQTLHLFNFIYLAFLCSLLFLSS